jgi:hypothetical protein
MAPFLKSVGQGSRSRFIDNAQDIESGNAAGVFSGLPLRIIEVRGNGNDSVDNFLAQRRLGIAFEFPENERGDLRCRVLTVEYLEANDTVAGCETSKGSSARSSRTSASPLPMNLLMEKTVFLGLSIIFARAGFPTRTLPPSSKNTTEGTRLLPSAPGSRVVSHFQRWQQGCLLFQDQYRRSGALRRFLQVPLQISNIRGLRQDVCQPR